MFKDLFKADQLIPEPFKEFLPFVSPSGLRVIHKTDVLNLTLKSVAQSLDSEKYRVAVNQTEILLQKFGFTQGVSIKPQIEPQFKLNPGNPCTLQKEVGEKILELYFFLIHSPAPLFLDFRSQHFGWDEQNKILHWVPSRIWHDRSDFFRTSVVALYQSFFSESTLVGTPGVSLYQWKTKASPGFVERIASLLQRHFGSAAHTPHQFSIHHFRTTFHEVFEEGIKSRSKFHPELAFLGTTLAGLYTTLEMINTPLDVAASYQRITGRI